MLYGYKYGKHTIIVSRKNLLHWEINVFKFATYFHFFHNFHFCRPTWGLFAPVRIGVLRWGSLSKRGRDFNSCQFVRFLKKSNRLSKIELQHAQSYVSVDIEISHPSFLDTISLVHLPWPWAFSLFFFKIT